MGMKNLEIAPDFGYCAAQSMYYYGYKLHAVCGVSGVIHSYDLSQANVLDMLLGRIVALASSGNFISGGRKVDGAVPAFNFPPH